MPFVSGPVGTLLVALVAIVALVLWLGRRRRYPGPRLESEQDDIDHDQLAQAEREVRDLDSNQRAEDDFFRL
jgi:hypothetical protein